MLMHTSNVLPRPDKVLTDIADYVAGYRIDSKINRPTAAYTGPEPRPFVTLQDRP